MACGRTRHSEGVWEVQVWKDLALRSMIVMALRTSDEGRCWMCCCAEVEVEEAQRDDGCSKSLHAHGCEWMALDDDAHIEMNCAVAAAAAGGGVPRQAIDHHAYVQYADDEMPSWPGVVGW